MGIFRKRPVEVKAWLINTQQSRDTIPAWVLLALYQGKIVFRENNILEIKTLEGTMRSQEDSYLVQGVNMELYPCRKDIFEKTYEFVSEE